MFKSMNNSVNQNLQISKKTQLFLIFQSFLDEKHQTVLRRTKYHTSGGAILDMANATANCMHNCHSAPTVITRNQQC